MPLLLIWHPRVQGGTPPGPTVETVRDYGAPGAGGARYPQERYLKRRKRDAIEEDELIQLLAVVIPLISRPAYG